MFDRALSLLREMLGPATVFRPGQWEAIETLAVRRRRALVVQRTGWGKSIVYFLATRLLRDQGAGPTLLISPLLSLMRNQILMAGRIGVRAATIHSGNRQEWDTIEACLADDQCDLLLVSPERLNNERFLGGVLPRVRGRLGLFVIDEAHCISDWGHDFRPDYQRIGRILQGIPRGVPVLATTATANNRVMQDVQRQLGTDLVVLRGSLGRPSLRLQNLPMPDQSHRLAWLAENVPKFQGSGIIYCLTVPDTERVARWLQSKGIAARAYHAGDAGHVDREGLEQALLNNEVKALVATVALGMGFDKADLGFVIHFQAPGSVVAYYQQVGRAGRGVNRAYGILLSGSEDDDIHKYFIDSAFPSKELMDQILDALGRTSGRSLNQLLDEVNISWPVAEKALKLLEVDGAVGCERTSNGPHYFRTPNRWQPDVQRMEQVVALRRAELAEMHRYLEHRGCLMEYLTRALDDGTAASCGVCANCQGRGFTTRVDPGRVGEAIAFLQKDDLVLVPRKRWPAGLFPKLKTTIAPEHQNAVGRILSYYGDVGWGKMVREGKYVHGHYGEPLVNAAAQAVLRRWRPEPPPAWVTAIPSRRHPRLVPDFAERLAVLLHLPFAAVLVSTREVPEQKTMANSAMQARNVQATLAVSGLLPAGPVLLIDDIIDSGWTLAFAGWLLRTHGSGVVYPLALARTTSRNN